MHAQLGRPIGGELLGSPDAIGLWPSREGDLQVLEIWIIREADSKARQAHILRQTRTRRGTLRRSWPRGKEGTARALTAKLGRGGEADRRLHTSAHGGPGCASASLQPQKQRGALKKGREVPSQPPLPLSRLFQNSAAVLASARSRSDVIPGHPPVESSKTASRDCRRPRAPSSSPSSQI